MADYAGDLALTLLMPKRRGGIRRSNSSSAAARATKQKSYLLPVPRTRVGVESPGRFGGAPRVLSAQRGGRVFLELPGPIILTLSFIAARVLPKSAHVRRIMRVPS